MSKLVCKNCRSVDVEYEGYIGGTSYICLTCGARWSKEKFTPTTLFDQITQSPETLANEFVSFDHGLYYSWFVGQYFNTYAEAIAATVVKLKEVVE